MKQSNVENYTINTQFMKTLEEFIELADRNWDGFIIEQSGIWANKTWNSPKGAMSAFELSYILDGNGILNMNNLKYEAKKGCFYFSDLSLHSSCLHHDIKMYYISFSTSSGELYRKLKSCYSRLANCIQPGCTGNLEELFANFHYEHSIIRFYSSLLSKHSFINILVTLYRLFLNAKTRENKIIYNSRHDKTVIEIIRYLNENFQENIELKSLSERYSLDPRYLNGIFKNTTGSTIIQYLIRLRVEKSKRLLGFTSMSITDVALDTGFCDCQHYCKMFKRLEGMTPTRFREGLIR